VSTHLTEEEQIAVMKRWWAENGKIVLTAIVIAVAGYFAITAWQDKQRAKAAEASNQYESLLKLTTLEPGKILSDADRATASHVAGELKEKHPKTTYAVNAAFFLAKLAVDAKELDKAAQELQWVLASKPDVATNQLAHVRLARVLLSKSAFTEASAQLIDEPSKAFVSEYEEVRGDILLAQGNAAAALTAYEKALANTDKQQQERGMILQMKIDNLKAPSAPVTENAPAVEEKK
jgi:predicted negative regulator of RcsB-dependent stress response